ncbi:MAG: 30S ribosomal protein S6 [Clostridia bacterium]|nr:30S ribosomal protein S6 [Clostridia bacterium]
MNKYEVLYIINNEVADEKKNDIVTRFSTLVEANGGNVITVDKWGTRKYAYPIDYKTEGYYVLMTFEAKGEFIAELERLMRNNESIVRELVTLAQ